MKLAMTATPKASSFAPIVWRGTPAEAYRLAAELGYEGVEWHLRQPDDIDAEVVCDLESRTGIRIPTIGTGMAAGIDGLTFADPDPEVRRRAVARVQAQIQLAARWRCAVTIGLIWGRVGADSLQRPERVKAALECLAECCRTAERAGVTVLLEPLNRYESDYPNTLAQGLEVIAAVGAANLKLLADTFHMNIEEVDLAASLRSAGALVGHVHLVDSNRQAPGHGHLDLDRVLAALAEIGYAGYLSFECLPAPSTQQAAADAIAYVRSRLVRPGGTPVDAPAGDQS